MNRLGWCRASGFSQDCLGVEVGTNLWFICDVLLFIYCKTIERTRAITWFLKTHGWAMRGLPDRYSSFCTETFYLETLRLRDVYDRSRTASDQWRPADGWGEVSKTYKMFLLLGRKTSQRRTLSASLEPRQDGTAKFAKKTFSPRQRKQRFCLYFLHNL